MQQVVIARQELRGLLFSDVFGFICSFIVLLIAMLVGLLNSASDALLMFALSNLFFVIGMMVLLRKLIHVSRPSKVWARELSGFREVFRAHIFL